MSGEGKRFKEYGYRVTKPLIEINKKFKLINQNSKVVDLGASPGGWTQVVAELQKNKNQIIAIDKKHMDPVKNCNFICDDISNLLNNNTLLDENYFDVIAWLFSHNLDKSLLYLYFLMIKLFLSLQLYDNL